MLYQKAIDKIDWNDVETFCQERIAEGTYLDYKQGFPNDLERIIAAMANTLGGLILIGVEEDKESKPVLPLKGVPFERGLSERVMNIILTNITPPVFPEIQVCPDPTGKNAIVVIRVHESDETPHAIMKNTRVYLRTGNRNNPEELAAIDDIGWLTDRRERSVDLRTALIAKARDHYFAMAAPSGKRLSSLISISLCPLYPKKQFMSPPSLNDILPQIRVRDYFGTSHQFPLPDQYRGRLLQDGIAVTSDELRGYYTELNIYGLYFYTQAIAPERELQDGRTTRVIRASEIFCRIDEVIDSAKKYFDILAYWGPLHYRVSLENYDDSKLITHRQGSYDDASLEDSPDDLITYEEVIPGNGLMSDRQRWITEPIQRICWAFDYNVTQKMLEQYYSKEKKR